MTNTPNSLIERKLEEFDKYYFVDKNGYWDKDMGNPDAKSIKIFLRNALLESQQEARRMAYEDCREIVREHGHEQDDGTIWCDMDEILQIIKKEQPNTSSDGEFC